MLYILPSIALSPVITVLLIVSVPFDFLTDIGNEKKVKSIVMLNPFISLSAGIVRNTSLAPVVDISKCDTPSELAPHLQHYRFLIVSYR